MAAASSEAAAGENLYSAINFRSYFRKLKAKCGAHKHACTVLHIMDPVTKFLLRKTAIKAELKSIDDAAAAAAGAGQVAAKLIPTEAQIKEDPQKHLLGFLKTLEKRTND